MSNGKKVIVVGAGPGGYVSAIRAAQLGVDVTVIEKSSPGGVCLNAGCIPTKALLSSIEVLLHVQNAGTFGINVAEVVPEFAQMVSRKDRIVEQLSKGIEFLFKKNGITLVKGEVKDISPSTVRQLGEKGAKEEFKAENIIVAQFDGEKVITSREALQLKQVPEKLLVVGGGAIGLEFAYIFSSLGTDVSVVEEMGQLLPGEDSEIAKLLKESLSRRKINIHTGVRVDGIEVKEKTIIAKLSSGDILEETKALIAVGRTPNTKGIGLEKMNLLDEKGFIKVNERMETAVTGIYAIGDAVGGMLLAHKASREGIVAAENIAGVNAEMRYDVVPRCIFTQPEVAAVGMSEDGAKESGREVKAGKFPFSALGKAHVIGETEGIVKILTDASSEEILGIHIIGPRASDLIGEASLAMELEATAETIAKTIHAHPTLAEAIMEASHCVSGKAIHI